MRGEVGDATDGVALHLDVRREHLTDQGLETAELDDGELVLGCCERLESIERKARGRQEGEVSKSTAGLDFPSGSPAATRRIRLVRLPRKSKPRVDMQRTIDCEVAESCARGTLDLDIVRVEEEEDGLEGFSRHLAHVLLGDLGEGESGRALEVDVVAV